MLQRRCRTAGLAKFSASALVAGMQHVAVLPAAACMASLRWNRIFYPQPVGDIGGCRAAGDLLARVSFFLPAHGNHFGRAAWCERLPHSLCAGGAQLFALFSSGGAFERLFLRVFAESFPPESGLLWLDQYFGCVHALLRAAVDWNSRRRVLVFDEGLSLGGPREWSGYFP